MGYSATDIITTLFRVTKVSSACRCLDGSSWYTQWDGSSLLRNVPTKDGPSL